jgi:hypothetical protein
MNRSRRITANIPADLLQEASEVTRKGITETLIQGLQLIKRGRAYVKAKALKGKLSLNVDLNLSRERPRH